MKSDKKNKEKQMDIEKERMELVKKMKKEIDPKLMETLDLIVKMNQVTTQRFEIINSPSGTSLNAK